MIALLQIKPKRSVLSGRAKECKLVVLDEKLYNMRVMVSKLVYLSEQVVYRFQHLQTVFSSFMKKAQKEVVEVMLNKVHSNFNALYRRGFNRRIAGGYNLHLMKNYHIQVISPLS